VLKKKFKPRPPEMAWGWFFFFRKGMMQRGNRADRKEK